MPRFSYAAPKAPALPKYRRHKPSGQAVVTLSGKDFYLGPYGCAASRREYDRLIGEWLAAGRCVAAPQADLTVAELAHAYWKFAQGYYRQNGQPTTSLERVKTSLRVLRQSYAHTSARDFGPLSLQALQHKLAGAGLSRRYINHLIDARRKILEPAKIWRLSCRDGTLE